MPDRCVSCVERVVKKSAQHSGGLWRVNRLGRVCRGFVLRHCFRRFASAIRGAPPSAGVKKSGGLHLARTAGGCIHCRPAFSPQSQNHQRHTTMHTKSYITSLFIIVTVAAASVFAFADEKESQAGVKGNRTNGQKGGANGQKNNGQQGQNDNGQQGQKDDGQQGQKDDGQQGQKDGGQQGQKNDGQQGQNNGGQEGQPDGAQKQQSDGGQKGPKNGVQQREKTPGSGQGGAVEVTRKQTPDTGKMVVKQDKLAEEAPLEKIKPERGKLSDAPKTEEERARQRLEEARQILDSRVVKLLGAGAADKK